MMSERTEETEALYAQGIEFFRTAQWSEAVQVFSNLRAISSAYPEIDALIADALLKIEIERTQMPEVVPPPRPIPAWLIGAAALALLLAGGAAAALRPAPSQPSETSTSVVRAVVAPTQAPRPTVLPPEPTAPSPGPTTALTAQPEAPRAPVQTSEPAAAAQSGTLTVRMADGQQLTRTIGNIEIILDASGSMLASVEGRLKIDIAHDSLTQLIDELPDATNIALRTYGHRRSNDCEDVELVAPLAPLDRTALINRVTTITPVSRGMTPIGLSLQQVADDLKDAQGDAVVVLVSDGEETCDRDPAQIAAQLRAANPQLRIDVVGFKIGQAEARARLSAIAQSGGGSYFDAGDAGQLVAALQQAVALSYRVLDAQGAEVYRGALGSAATLPPGRYAIEISGAASVALSDFNVRPGASTTIQLREQGGTLTAALIP
jgi:Mg-chelatase subunit ChlD